MQGTRYGLEKDEGMWEAGPGPVNCQIKGFGLYSESKRASGDCIWDLHLKASPFVVRKVD